MVSGLSILVKEVWPSSKEGVVSAPLKEVWPTNKEGVVSASVSLSQ